MDNCLRVANLYLATLKSIAFIHQHNHWTISGVNFYGNHLLFQRLYDSVTANVDSAAEKFIGLLGKEAVDYSLQIDLVSKIMSKYKDKTQDAIEMSLAVEKDFIKLSSELYKIFEKENKLTEGLDDLILSIANEHEESIYLLQQSK